MSGDSIYRGNDTGDEWYKEPRKNIEKSLMFDLNYESLVEILREIISLQPLTSFTQDEEQFNISIKLEDESDILSIMPSLAHEEDFESVSYFELQLTIKRETYEITELSFTLEGIAKLFDDLSTSSFVMHYNLNDIQYELNRALEIPNNVIEISYNMDDKQEALQLLSNAVEQVAQADSIRIETEINASDQSDDYYFYTYLIERYSPSFLGYTYAIIDDTVVENQYDDEFIYVSVDYSEDWEIYESDETYTDEIRDDYLEIISLYDNHFVGDIYIEEDFDFYYINFSTQFYSDEFIKELTEQRQDLAELLAHFNGQVELDYIEEEFYIDKETGQLVGVYGVASFKLGNLLNQVPLNYEYYMWLSINDVEEDEFSIFE